MTHMPLKRPNVAMTPAEAQLSAALPSRYDEEWKWTSVSTVTSGKETGLTGSCNPQIFVPEGVIVTQENVEATSNLTWMGQLAANVVKQIWKIEVPADFTSETPIQIEGLNHGHALISLSLGKGVPLPRLSEMLSLIHI